MFLKLIFSLFVLGIVLVSCSSNQSKKNELDGTLHLSNKENAQQPDLDNEGIQYRAIDTKSWIKIDTVLEDYGDIIDYQFMLPPNWVNQKTTSTRYVSGGEYQLAYLADKEAKTNDFIFKIESAYSEMRMFHIEMGIKRTMSIEFKEHEILEKQEESDAYGYIVKGTDLHGESRYNIGKAYLRNGEYANFIFLCDAKVYSEELKDSIFTVFDSFKN